MKVNLRPFQQEQPSTCLPACLRIVLDFFGIKMPEAVLARACKTNHEGTQFKDAALAMRLQDLAVVELREADLFELVDHIKHGRPIIAAINIEQIPYGGTGTHAVVVYEFEKNQVKYIDPALGKSIALDLISFFKAWDSYGCSGLVIYPKSKPKSKTPIRRKKK